MNISKRAFTILEMIIVTVIVGSIFIIVISLYSKMFTSKLDAEAKQMLIHGSYNVLEKLNVMMKDYTIDYDEYFNRRVVWCDGNWWTSFSWTGSEGVGTNWYCDKFTSYWNSWWNSNNWKLYYCSSVSWSVSPDPVMEDVSVKNWSGCWDNITYGNWKSQAFGQYKLQFIDTKNDINGTGGLVWDDDDIDVWKWPVSIADNTNVKELYLISKDNKSRIFIKRAFIASWNWDFSGTAWDSDIDNLYTLQMLKLKWFDAWSAHSFNDSTDWDYDWKVDTWACDYSQGFVCQWNWLWGVYDNYKLPTTQNVGYVNIFSNDVSIKDWKLEIYPVNKSSYSFVDNSMQLNPYIKVYIKTKLYGQPWSWKINPAILNAYELDLQTTFNIRNNY